MTHNRCKMPAFHVTQLLFRIDVGKVDTEFDLNTLKTLSLNDCIGDFVGCGSQPWLFALVARLTGI